MNISTVHFFSDLDVGLHTCTASASGYKSFFLAKLYFRFCYTPKTIGSQVRKKSALFFKPASWHLWESIGDDSQRQRILENKKLFLLLLENQVQWPRSSGKCTKLPLFRKNRRFPHFHRRGVKLISQEKPTINHKIYQLVFSGCSITQWNWKRSHTCDQGGNECYRNRIRKQSSHSGERHMCLFNVLSKFSFCNIILSPNTKVESRCLYTVPTVGTGENHEENLNAWKYELKTTLFFGSRHRSSSLW